MSKAGDGPRSAATTTTAALVCGVPRVLRVTVALRLLGGRGARRLLATIGCLPRFTILGHFQQAVGERVGAGREAETTAF